MSLSLTPSKRQHNRNSKELNNRKFQKTSSFDSPKDSRKSLSGGDVFRVLCPSSIIERVIGEGENVISQIRQETGAKVRVDGPALECDERVIFIMGPDKEAQDGDQHSKKDNKDSQLTKEQVDSEDHKDNIGGKDTLSTTPNSQTSKGTSSVQKALLLVLEKFIEGVRETENTSDTSNGSGTVTFRLLVLSSQVGCLLGKGGSVIKEMSAKSGAQIRILPRDKLPQCASSADDIVQIVGVGDAARKAIQYVSDQIMENAAGDQDGLPSDSSGPSSNSLSQPIPRSESQSARSLPFRGAPLGGGFRNEVDLHSNGPPFIPKFHDDFMPHRKDIPDIVTFRLLCPDERIGGIIGKGGAIIKALQHETRCDIKVTDGNSDGEERTIIVSGPAHPDDKISVVQHAILRIQNRIANATPESMDKGVTAKLLVPSHQIGSLLGKGGSIITEMRMVTGAHIRILGKDQQLKGASDDEVVQINGELEVVQEAILQITTRLLHHYFRDVFPSANLPSNSGFSDRAPPLSALIGRREYSPSGMFPEFGPPFRSFDSIRAPPMHVDLRPHDDHPPFRHDFNRHGIPDGPWRSLNSIEGGPRGLLDYGGPHERRMSGIGGGSQQAIITNTTVEVVVPSSVVPSIYGEGGGCLKQIRLISDAKIIIHDPKPGIPETLIIISGTPEQTHAAQSLIQAFVMIENESS